MRLSRLDLERFGHFRGAKLLLGDARSLILVHGNNEAGKTTVLEAIRWLLFGGTSARYALDGDAAKLSVGARIELSSGPIVDIRRTRGKGAGLRGQTATGDEVDEDWISGRLTRPNRTVFENVFGFSLAGLVEGAKTLEHAELRNVIYGGGLGGTVQPDAILADLKVERESLFTERAHNRELPATAKKIADLEKRIRASTTRADEWEKLEGDRRERAGAADVAAVLLADRRRQVDLMRAQLEAIEPARRRAAAIAEREALPSRSTLPADVDVRHAALVAQRDALAREQETLAAEIRRAEDTLESLVVDEDVLAKHAAISSVAAGLDRFIAATNDRERRAGELLSLERRIADRLTSLQRGWDLDRLRALPIDAVTRDELDRTIADEEARTVELKRTTRALGELDDELHDADVERVALPTAVELGPLRALLEAVTETSAELKSAASLEAELRGLERKHASKLAQLDPQPTVPLREVVIPNEDDLRLLEVERDALEKRRALEELELARLRSELAAAEDELRAIDPEGRVPTDDELLDARSARTELFDRVLENPKHAVEYDRAVRRADDLADRMREHADAVQRRTHARARCARAQSDITRATFVLGDAMRSLAEHDERFRARFSGVVPRTAMRRWLEQREAALALHDAIVEARIRCDALDKKVASVHEGARVLGLSGSLDELKPTIQEKIATEERRARDLDALEKLLRKRQPKRAALVVELERLGDGATFKDRFPRLLAAAGLPVDLTPAAARTLVGGLVDARHELLHAEVSLRSMLTTLDAELAHYVERVRALSTAADVEVAVRALDGELGTARSAAAERQQATSARATALRRREAVELERSDVESALGDLYRAADVANGTALLAVVIASRRRAELDAEIDRADRLLSRHDVTALIGLDEHALAAQLVRVEQAITTLEEEVRAQERSVGDAAARLAAIDGRADAADALSELESERATLAEHGERYAVLTLADQLLRGAIRRFEHQHQPGVLSRASKIFSAMTGGRYRAIRKSGEELVVEREDETELKPEVLSTGAKEQLYLAIRLAYVEHYCARAEPLPVVLDDVLVNFDDNRALATLQALASFSATTQVILFTCHQSTLALAASASIDALTIEIPAVS